MKKIFAAVLVICLLLSLTACSCTTNFHSSSTVTHTTTDANGNTTTTTSTTTNDNGKVSESTETVTVPAGEAAPAEEVVTCAMLAEDGQTHSFPYRIENKTEHQIVAFYTTAVDGNVADYTNGLNDAVVEPGMSIFGDFSYNKDNLVFDFVFYFNENDFVRIPKVDCSNVRADTDTVVIQFVETSPDTFSLIPA